jgi:aminoglycoside 6'-N-acetyltransferase I
VIEALTTRDLAACAELYVETFSAPPWNETWRAEDAVQRLGDILATPRAHGVRISTPGDALAGFAVGHLERSGPEDHFLLQEMCVRSGRRRQGHGTALLGALRAAVPEARHWYLLTARDSAAARFYTRNGFRPAGRMGVFVRP